MKRNNYKHAKNDKQYSKMKKLSGLIFICIFVVASIAAFYFYVFNIANKTSDSEIANEVIADEETNKDDEAVMGEIQVQEPIKQEILLSFAGDFTLGTDTKFAYDSSLPAAFINSGRNYNYFMQNVSSVFGQDDYTLVNLETTLTDSNVKAEKDGDVFYNFKGSKDYVNILSNASIDGVTIANNHIYDYGKEGVNDTVSALQANNIDICGEGYKILREIKGVKFGFLGYTAWDYTDGIRNKLINDIGELREQGADVVIPYFHWGIERQYEPYNVQQNLAKFAIDNGADAVVGSHPHVIQSMENYKGKLIVYSMGNFCFGGNSNPSDKRTFILQMKLNTEDNKVVNFEYKVIPAMISSRNDRNDYIPTLAQGDRKTDILNTLNSLSPTLNGCIKDEFFSL